MYQNSAVLKALLKKKLKSPIIDIDFESWKLVYSSQT